MLPKSLEVIGLISGGKDSLFSLLHCLANGHKIVALANLHPVANTTDDDIDSFMFQTVGHQLVPLYEQLLGIPLYRAPIIGTAVNSSLDYQPTSHLEKHSSSPSSTPSLSPSPTSTAAPDEVESLTSLLRTVLTQHRTANALSTGAILSTYQRTRIESVARRLGLVPLSYLWQFPALPPHDPAALLHDMRAAGIEARILKTASAGLDARFLWADVACRDGIGRLQRAMGRWGAGEGDAAVLGEGGEYETLAVRGPRPLWKGWLETGEVETRVLSGGGGYAKIEAGRVRLFAEDEGAELEEGVPRVPDLLDEDFEAVLRKVKELRIDQKALEDASGGLNIEWGLSDIPECYGSGFVLNLRSTSGDAANQTREMMARLKHHLQACGENTTVTSTSLLLRDMSHFAAVNSAYDNFFPNPNPPSRVTVAIGSQMPKGIDVLLSAVLDTCSSEKRKGLHVQSRSYWAPANIGPYSQAITVPLEIINDQASGWNEEGTASVELVHVAGQIPLLPASMKLVAMQCVPESLRHDMDDKLLDFKIQCVLSLQHVWRIGRATKVDTWTGAVGFLSSCNAELTKKRSMVAAAAWAEINDYHYARYTADDDAESSDIDLWDLKNRRDEFLSSPTRDKLPLLPDFPRLKLCSQGLLVPPCFIVQLESLPRGAAIEWQSLGIRQNCAETISGRSIGHGIWATTLQETDVAYYIRVDKVCNIGSALQRLPGSWRTMKMTVYTTKPVPREWLKQCQMQVVPCRSVYEGGGPGLGDSGRYCETLVTLTGVSFLRK